MYVTWEVGTLRGVSTQGGGWYPVGGQYPGGREGPRAGLSRVLLMDVALGLAGWTGGGETAQVIEVEVLPRYDWIWEVKESVRYF